MCQSGLSLFSVKMLLFCGLLLLVVSCYGVPSPTTKSYDIEVPGSNPIRIFEAESPWPTAASKKATEKFEHRGFSNRRNGNNDAATTLRTKTSLHDPTAFEEKDRVEVVTEYSSIPLEEFIKSYAEKNKIDSYEKTESEKPRHSFGNSYKNEFPKRWDMMHAQKHNHPFDDRKGWVSLEPVPWSVAKISKWNSRYKPQEPAKPSWMDDYSSSYSNSGSNYNHYNKNPYKPRPTNNFYNEQNNYYMEEPSNNGFYDRNSNTRPSFSSPYYVQKLQVQSSIDYPGQVNKLSHKHDEDCDHFGDIITDGLPPNFPEPPHQQMIDPNRRQGNSEPHPASYPFNGDGEWVLLSTTKGYKYPKHRSRERSLNLDGDANNSIGVHRSVRLTVLPPLKNSKVNMTTSHGGLLQVESTQHTVEEDHRQHLKKQKQKVKQHQQQKPSRRPNKVMRLPNQVKDVTASTVTTRNNAPDTSAVLAAVGAGMIPATMAMLLPMAMSRGSRKRRSVRNVTSNPSNVEITLPRSL